MRERSASIRLRVPFYDVDMLNIVWHGHYLKYFDLARQAFFNRYGLESRPSADRHYIFPVIRTSVKYIHPLKFNDEFICSASVRSAKIKLVMDFEIRLAGDDCLCATGTTEHAAVRMPEMELELRIPEDIEKAIIGPGDCEDSERGGDARY